MDRACSIFVAAPTITELTGEPRRRSTETPNVAVYGLGNTLLADDGVGPVAAQYLEEGFVFPKGTVVADLGTPGLDLTPYLLDVDDVLFIDAVDFNAKPGAIRLFSQDEIFSVSTSPRVSPHDPGVQQALQTVRLYRGRPINAYVLGVAPQHTALGAPLSPAVDAAVPKIVRITLQWLAARGVYPENVKGYAEAP